MRGLVWRSHLDQTGFFATENRHLGERLQRRGAEVLLDMRVRAGGSHHQKFVVIRHRDDPSRDVAFVGGIDLAHNRRDDADHHGDPQPQPLTDEYGPNPPWHDLQVRIQGPAVHDVETVFRERWEDPTPLSRSPLRRLSDRAASARRPARTRCRRSSHRRRRRGRIRVQLLRTYPNLRHGRDFPFARGGERSVARGYTKAIARASGLVYVEDQYFWGHDVADPFLARRCATDPSCGWSWSSRSSRTSTGSPGSRSCSGATGRSGPSCRWRPDGWRPTASRTTPAHPSTCTPRSASSTTSGPASGPTTSTGARGPTTPSCRAWCWTTDYARSLRLTLAAEHLDRLDEVEADGLEQAMADCVEPVGLFDAYAASADRLDAWHAAGRVGERPPGRLRRLPLPELTPWQRRWAKVPLEVLHDPDGRPGPIRGGQDY